MVLPPSEDAWVLVAPEPPERGQVVDGLCGDVVVWTSHEGEVVVMDSRCPHEWSHLGAEGVVDGAEIVCTSHWWRFDACGGGSKLNVAGRRDEKAPIPVFPTEVRSGAIWALLPTDRLNVGRLTP